MKKPWKKIIISLYTQTFMYKHEEILNKSAKITPFALIEKMQEFSSFFVEYKWDGPYSWQENKFRICLQNWISNWVPGIIACGSSLKEYQGNCTNF